MLVHIVRRLLISVPVLLASSVLVFLMVANSGDPLAELRGRNPPVPEQVIQTRRAQLHLDRPLPERYWLWARQFVRGDMGRSLRGLDVRPQLVRRIGVTLRMVLLAIVLAVLLAVASGVLSAVRQYTVTDYVLTLAGFLFLSMPAFWLAALLEVLGSDHLRMARAKGLPRRRVIVRHALRNALAPLVTVVAIDAAGILGGVFVVEWVFSWHGLGELFVQGLLASDLNVVLACLMVTSVIVVVFNLLADIVYAVLDPRIRTA